MTRYRDAGTGRYVTEKYAKTHPRTTVSESNKSRKFASKKK
ncbi:hypothetical protein [Legionella micdadei]|uniref:Uncharacterized protein n=1 Tax=Legionella micdadei TaxID=451 RepID=A0A098GE14_LEGMI|nr:hypothetical protein [Legionella micdadei]ARG96502.1 multidrug transporter [Legionella micdadei]ARG99253.1 multidrug transporter [Legionella micdadei]NSL19647.1 multidrug transporter [Legionella micdadei]CEG59726.1 conserved protein of unknown function [Legionella micdadei]SCY80812.1 hypothetical protein SAMN02982997_03001 [Legionella micdadei]